jgi:glycosyltransferase involved in cell wall biosynthesis
MISFIVIGRNEGWKLTNCLESVFKTILVNKLSDFEVIFVDSKSTDDSIKRANVFSKIKIFQITGSYNAAIARNIGAKESTGNVLFFIDGDMEIQADFLPTVYNLVNGQLKYDFVSGHWIDYNYDSKGLPLSKEQYDTDQSHDNISARTGGLFLIKRELWNKVGGMKNKMRKSQDLDLGLRLAKKGHFLVRKKELLAIHHTIPYNDNSRIWHLLFSRAQLYRVVLLRENFLNKFEWELFLRGNYTFFIMLFSILLSIFFSSPFYILLYFISVIARILARKDRCVKLFLTSIIYFPIFEISLLLGFFLFWPKDHKELYIAIN